MKELIEKFKRLPKEEQEKVMDVLSQVLHEIKKGGHANE